MQAATFAALLFTMALLMTTTYFLLGSVPLLILKHDTSLDSRFIRGFYNTYYLAAIFTASGTSVSYALAGRPSFAAGASVLAILAVGLRRKVIGQMDLYRNQIQADHADAIPGFRKTHLTAILINLIQLILIVWSLTRLSL